MLTKFCILLVVGCTLTLAVSAHQNQTHALANRQRRGIFSTLGSWLNKATKMVDTLFQGVTYPYRKVFNLLLQTGQGITDYGLEKVHQAVEKFYDIKFQYQKNLDEIKNDILKRVIEEMQKVINVLAEEADVKTCDEMKQLHQEVAQSGQEALDTLEQELQDAVDAELKNLQDELDNWNLEAEGIVEENKKKVKKISDKSRLCNAQ